MNEGVVAVIRRDLELLVIRRAATVPFPGVWTLVSGRIEPGEEPAAAVVREVHEEVGMVVRAVREVWECPSSDGRYRLRWWLTDPIDARAELMLEPLEVAEARWILPSQLRGFDPIFEADLHFLDEILPTISD